MGRRSDIDWERVERLYVAGQLTVREVAKECGISVSTLTLKAKELSWQRSLANAIKQRTREKVSQIDVQELIEQSAQQSEQQSAQTLKRAIEDAANTSVAVRLAQRADIKGYKEQGDAIRAMLDEAVSSAEGIGDILRATQAYKNLADVRMKLQDREDKIYGLAEDQDEGDEPEGICITLVSAEDGSKDA